MARTLVAVLFLLASSSAATQPQADHPPAPVQPWTRGAHLENAAGPAHSAARCRPTSSVIWTTPACERARMLSTAYIFGGPTRKIEDGAAEADGRRRLDDQAQVGAVSRASGRLLQHQPAESLPPGEAGAAAPEPQPPRPHQAAPQERHHQLPRPRALERVRRIDRAANGYRMPIIVHMRSSTTAKLPYSRGGAAILSLTRFCRLRRTSTCGSPTWPGPAA